MDKVQRNHKCLYSVRIFFSDKMIDGVKERKLDVTGVQGVGKMCAWLRVLLVLQGPARPCPVLLDYRDWLIHRAQVL